MLEPLEKYIRRPDLYEESSDKFWDDEHISKGMLAAHLNPNWDAATRNLDFVRKSVAWIAGIAPPDRFPKLLDLGCGPGVYAQQFHAKGYSVTGIDFSLRSIDFAKEQSVINDNPIKYQCQNYLNIDFNQEFDVITLIYCDFGVLSTQNRRALLEKIYRALKPGGKLIFDVFTPRQYVGVPENTSWERHKNGGFWNAKAHLCLNSLYRYDDENTVVNQTIVITAQSVHCYNIWEHCFTEESLISELTTAGFTQYELFGDISGGKYEKEGKIICAVSSKR